MIADLIIIYRVRKRHEGFETLARFGARLATWGGTRFQGANCTGASFAHARLGQANFAGANLTRVNWHGALAFPQANFRDPSLEIRPVENLLLTGNGKGQSFVRMDLHGLNLAAADLREADLTEAICTGVDFMGAKLTGACLENWNIDSTTILQDVDCDYVFLLQNPVNGHRKRRPADTDRKFEPGEFEELYRKMVDEIQILLKKGLTPDGMKQALRKIAEENPGAKMTKMEDREESILTEWKLPIGAKEETFERSARGAWEDQLKIARLEAREQLLLEQKNDLKEIAVAAGSAAPNYFGGNMNKRENNFSGTINNSGQIGAIGGDASNLIQQLHNSPQTRELAEKLGELTRHIEAAPNLTSDEKGDARNSIEDIAKAATKTDDPAAQSAARRAWAFLKGAGERLGDVSKLVEAGMKLYDAASKSGML